MSRIKLKQFSMLLFSFSIIFAVPVGFAQESASDESPKSRLIESVKNWVAAQERIEPDNIEVQANDRRFIVPDCAEEFSVVFAFGTKTNVQVNCVSNDWQAVLRIQITTEYEILAFSRALTQGDAISSGDIIVRKVSSFSPGSNLISALEAEGRLLKIDVEEGQVVRPNQFEDTLTIFAINQDISEGQTLTAAMIEERIVPASETSFEQRFEISAVVNSVMTRDLSSGSVLTNRDFAIASPAMVMTELVERGNMIDASNSQIQSVLARVPEDAIISRSQVQRATAKRRLTPGEVLRFSDITNLPHVIADTSTTLELKKPSFSLTMEVLAMEDGYIGDRIRVRNQESGEIIYATVMGVGLVQVQ